MDTACSVCNRMRVNDCIEELLKEKTLANFTVLCRSAKVNGCFEVWLTIGSNP